MLGRVKKCRIKETFKYKVLRNVVKEGGENVIANLEEKYKELKIERKKRRRVAETLYTKPRKETLYIGSKSEARKRYQGSNDRPGSSYQFGESYGRGERQKSSS